MANVLNPSEWLSQVQTAKATAFRFTMADCVSYLCPECARREVATRGNKFQLVRDGIMKVHTDEPTNFLPNEHSCSGCDCDLTSLEEMQEEPSWGEADIIHEYSRTQAIEDGFLVDVSATAREHGFRYPVAIAIEAYETCIEWKEDKRTGMNIKKIESRLDNLLREVASLAAISVSDRAYFSFPHEDRETHSIFTAELVTVCGPGDSSEPVITIMFPHEE